MEIQCSRGPSPVIPVIAAGKENSVSLLRKRSKSA
jgi:hypothetical protein